MTDVVQDALGIEGAARVLDIEGVRGYRTSLKPVPLHALLTSQRKRLWPPDSSGWPESLDFEPILMLLGWIRGVDRNGVEESVDHLTGDIVRSFAGLCARTEEYRKFVDRVERQLTTGKPQSEATRAFCEDTRKRLDALRESVAAMATSPPNSLSVSVEKLRTGLTTGGAARGQSQYREFRDLSRKLLKERQAMLAKYREFAKSVRDKAGLTIVCDAGARDLCEELRRRAGNVLRNRYYLEGDWRGEEPL